MTVNLRALVPAPEKELLTYGLFSVAEIRPEPRVNGKVDPHWKNGIEWQNVCPDGQTTYDKCISAGALGVSGLADPPPKAATASRSRWGATPFTVFVEVDCSAPGFWDNADEIVKNTFTESEQFEVEQAFWTGSAGAANLVFPHLAASTALVDGLTTLQLAAANVGPTGGVPLDVVEALGKIEQALSACVKGVGVIHITCELLPHLVAQHLLTEENGIYYSPAGHKISISAANLGTSPDGVLTPNVRWMYATGPVFLYRNVGTFVGNRIESLDRSVNTEKRIYERTYVIGYDCCLFAVAVSTGGIVTGTPAVAT